MACNHARRFSGVVVTVLFYFDRDVEVCGIKETMFAIEYKQVE